MNTTAAHCTRKCFFGFLLLLIWVNPAFQHRVVAQAPLPDHFIYLPFTINKPYPDVEILDNYSITNISDSGLSVGYAEIVNHKNNQIEVNALDIDTFDANHELIRTITVHVYAELTRTSSTNDKTCVDFYINKPLRTDPDIASIRFGRVHFIDKASFLADYSADFNVLDSVLYPDNTAIEGRVRNNGAKSIDGVRIIGTYYNPAGKVASCAGTALSPFDSFDPGEVHPFSFTPNFYYADGALTYRLQIFAFDNPF